MDQRFFPQTKGQNSDPVVGSLLRQFRRRCTIAEINAGVDILVARPGVRYRLIDYEMIAVGGAVGGATTIDITAILAGSSRKLAAVAIAALTQSAVNRPGLANNTPLADGASFTANDANTAVRANKTGATATTATHVDIILTYAVEFAS